MATRLAPNLAHGQPVVMSSTATCSGKVVVNHVEPRALPKVEAKGRTSGIRDISRFFEIAGKQHCISAVNVILLAFGRGRLSQAEETSFDKHN